MDLSSCCTRACLEKCNLKLGNELKREKRRWRYNWLFTSSIASLYAISNTSISSSFHQFVTNPRTGLNGTVDEFQFGLGQSEAFYSWVLAVFYVGSFIGAMLSGFLVRCFPYWYLFMTCLLAHIIGYILYAITYEGWLIMISKFLSGYFLGAQVALSFSYASETSVEYGELLKKWKQRRDEGTVTRVRNYLFASQSIGKCFGYVLGPSAAVVFAQYPIDQFRSIAWYNMGFGVALLIMQVIIFRGESSFKKISQCRNICQCANRKTQFRLGPLTFFLLASIVMLRLVESFRFGVYETLLNPILSDSFGLDERDASYYFLGVAAAQIFGVVILIVLQSLRTSSQLTAIIGIVMTITACALIADWQAIPYDPCTEYSPFHHPEITKNYSHLNVSSMHSSIRRSADTFPLPELTELRLLSSNEFKFSYNTDFAMEVDISCHIVRENECNQHSSAKHLYYTYDTNGNMESVASIQATSNGHPLGLFLCSASFSAEASQPIVCVRLYGTDTISHQNKDFTEDIEDVLKTVHIQTLMKLPKTVYDTAKMNCIHANVTNRHCHWMPSSNISNKECQDCQPICRSKEQSLNFVQFLIGTIVLMIAFPILWVPVAAMASNQVPLEYQGIVMGIVAAMDSVGRSISPLFLDASYEAMQKRTFLPMILLAGCHLFFLVEILVFYRRLGPNENSPSESKSEGTSDDDFSDNEQTTAEEKHLLATTN